MMLCRARIFALATIILLAPNLVVSGLKTNWTVAIYNNGEYDPALIGKLRWLFESYLSRQVGARFSPPLNYDVVTVTSENITSSLESKSMDFILMNAAMTSCMDAVAEFSTICTLTRSNQLNEETHQLAGVILVRNDNENIHTLSDLKGKVVGVQSLSTLGGSMGQRMVLKDAHIDFFEDLEQIRLNPNNSKLLDDLRIGKLDAIFAESGALMNSSDFRVLAMQENTEAATNSMNESYPYVRSTRLYPDWGLSVLEHAQQYEMVLEETLNTLLSFNGTSNVSGIGFRMASPYSCVRTLEAELRSSLISESGDTVCQALFSNAVVCSNTGQIVSESELSELCDEQDQDCPEDYICICKPCSGNHSYASFPHWFFPVAVAGFAVVLLLTALLGILIFINQESKIIRAAQPIFLYIICIGVLLASCPMLLVALDSQTASDFVLERSCMSSVWLYFVGSTVTLSAVLLKMRRVKYLMIERSKNKRSSNDPRISHEFYIWRLGAIILLECVLLTLWSILAPLHYDYVCVEEGLSGQCKYMGKCTGDYFSLIFAASSWTSQIGLMVATLLLCCTVHELPEEFAEHKWITVDHTFKMEAYLFMPFLLVLTWNSTLFRPAAIIIFILFTNICPLITIILPKVFMTKTVVTEGALARQDLLYSIRREVINDDEALKNSTFLELHKKMGNDEEVRRLKKRNAKLKAELKQYRKSQNSLVKSSLSFDHHKSHRRHTVSSQMSSLDLSDLEPFRLNKDHLHSCTDDNFKSPNMRLAINGFTPKADSESETEICKKKLRYSKQQASKILHMMSPRATNRDAQQKPLTGVAMAGKSESKIGFQRVRKTSRLSPDLKILHESPFESPAESAEPSKFTNLDSSRSVVDTNRRKMIKIVHLDVPRLRP